MNQFLTAMFISMPMIIFISNFTSSYRQSTYSSHIHDSIPILFPPLLRHLAKKTLAKKTLAKYKFITIIYNG